MPVDIVTLVLDKIILRKNYVSVGRCFFRFAVTGISHTANSPISASSIPLTSASSDARKLKPGIKFITNNMMQVPPNEYAKPEILSASW